MAAVARSCDQCAQSFRVISSQAGHQVRCPHCGATNKITAALFAAPKPKSPAVVAAGQIPTAAPPIEAAEGGGGPDNGSQVKDGGASRLQQLAQTVSTVSSRTRRQLGSERGWYKCSTLAKVTDFVAFTLFALSFAVLVYTLATVEWSEMTDLPVDLFLPAFALCMLPWTSVALTGLGFLLAAHAVEYLAMLAAADRT